MDKRIVIPAKNQDIIRKYNRFMVEMDHLDKVNNTLILPDFVIN